MPTIEVVIYTAVVFLFAGWVKGVVGMGLPTVAMGALGLAMAPVQAAALLVVPSLVTNVWQFVAGPGVRNIIRRLAVMMVFVCIGTALGIRWLVSDASRWPAITLGAVLTLYALLALFLPKLSVPARWESRASPVVGFATGVLTGATGVFVVPAVPYLSAIGMSKDELVQALGLSFTISTIALGIALGSMGRYPIELLLVSFAAVLPALLGMFIGQRMRDRIEPDAFRRWFFVAMLLIGSYMLIRGIIAR